MLRRKSLTKVVASIVCALLALCGGVCVAGSAKAVPHSEPGPLGEGDVIYQVLVDRFENGDSANDDFGDGASYHGYFTKDFATPNAFRVVRRSSSRL